MSARPAFARIAVMAVVAIAAMTLCVFAGCWQWGRHLDRAHQVAIYDANVHAAPVTLEVVARADHPDEVTWRTVSAHGTLSPDVTILRNRPVDRAAAVHALVWLDTDHGPLALNLGYRHRDGDEPLRVPTGEVSVLVVWRAWEEHDGRTGDGATRIAPEQLAAPAGALDGYGVVLESTTHLSPSDVGLTAAPVPTPSLGPHLAYAWQWWIFAVMIPVGGVYLYRQRAEPVMATSPAAPPSRRRRGWDEDVEDALLDAQERGLR